MIEPIY